MKLRCTGFLVSEGTCNKRNVLGGGLKDFLLSPLPGEDSQFD